MSEFVKYSLENDVAVLTLNDPDRLNALSLKMVEQLHDKIKLINSGETGARCLCKFNLCNTKKNWHGQSYGIFNDWRKSIC